jgi:hypothetical protein
LGLRQVVMALMNWAIDVPQKLLQSDARLFPKMKLNIYFIIKVNIFIFILIKYIIERFIIHLFLICFFIFNRKKLNLESRRS